MKEKDYKAEIILFGPNKEESNNCRERIWNLIEELIKAKKIARDESEPQNKRDFQIHHIHYLANRLLNETGG